MFKNPGILSPVRFPESNPSAGASRNGLGDPYRLLNSTGIQSNGMGIAIDFHPALVSGQNKCFRPKSTILPHETSPIHIFVRKQRQGRVETPWGSLSDFTQHWYPAQTNISDQKVPSYVTKRVQDISFFENNAGGESKRRPLSKTQRGNKWKVSTMRGAGFGEIKGQAASGNTPFHVARRRS